MKTRTTLILLTAGVLLAGTAAVTARGFGYGPGGCWGPGGGFGGPGQAMFNTADANKDGTITRAEAQAVRDNMFAKFDTDKNGSVNAEEIDSGLSVMVDAMKVRVRYRLLSRFDANGDGQISKDEFGKNALLRFDRVDVNNDGKVTRDEMLNMRMMNRGGRGMYRGRRGGGQGMWRQGRGGRGGSGWGRGGGYRGMPGMMGPWGGQ